MYAQTLAVEATDSPHLLLSVAVGRGSVARVEQQHERRERSLAELRAALPEGEFTRAWAQGQALSADPLFETALTPIAEAATA